MKIVINARRYIPIQQTMRGNVIQRYEQGLERIQQWKESHALLLKRIRKIYIWVIWLLLPVAIFFWLFLPVSRSALLVWFWSYYALWQVWILARSKTVMWTHVARFFVVGIWLVGPLCAGLLWSFHYVFADGAASIQESWSAVLLGPIVEEVIKLLPLIIFLFVTGKERQLSLTDYALFGFALGTGFQFMEEVIRMWVTSRESMLGMFISLFHNNFKAWGFQELFPGYFAYGDVIAAGHHVWTGFVALGIGFAIHFRHSLGKWMWFVPVFLLLWSIFEHAAYNAQVDFFTSDVLIRLLHFFTGNGHGYKWLFVFTLLFAVYLDYRTLNRHKLSLPLLPHETLLEPLTEGIELIKSILRSPKKWATTMLFLRERRAYGFAIALKEREKPRQKFRHQVHYAYRLLGFSALLLLCISSVTSMTIEEPYYLAGLFDGLSAWWGSLSSFEKTGVIITTGAATLLLTVATGGGILGAGFTAFGTGMLAKDTLENSRQIADFLRDPKSFLKQLQADVKEMPPQELLIKLSGLGLDFASRRIPGGKAGIDWLSNLQSKSQQFGKKTKMDGHGQYEGKPKASVDEDQGGGGEGNKGITNATKNNYRKLYLEQFPDLPKRWQVHHTLPQKYETIMKNAGINIHEVQHLKGIDPKIHSKITNEWSKWDKKLGRTPTSQDIIDFANTIESKYGKYWHNK
ncbi:PrsW family glutamic-type intramembrane protease [Gracilibacillus xinjiangensis]|uniref:PrsW family glutamic-type intramembrane protease n=1 Tax=Gracilibacillus xinjiangensis TaxID=1193282 RepID=A0ABV8WWB5_9BACI